MKEHTYNRSKPECCRDVIRDEKNNMQFSEVNLHENKMLGGLERIRHVGRERVDLERPVVWCF